MRVVAATMFASALLALCLMFPAAARAADEGETVEQTICRLIDTAAKGEGLPVAFLTRLIWQESRFETDAVSPEGARGIAQFMPGTADARGVVNPFDPEEAIPKAASLLSDLAKQFGNLGLAAAAYNAGSGKVSRYIAGQTELPFQTESYVEIVTGHTAEEWKGPNADKLTPESVFPNGSCEETVAAARAGSGATLITASPFSAPWGVQISGSFNKEAALRAYQHASSRLCFDPRRRPADDHRRRAAQPRLPSLLPRQGAGADPRRGEPVVQAAVEGRRRLRRAAQRIFVSARDG